jgi:hypothetical protein
MNWFKENPVIAAIAAVALIGTIVTGFLAIEGAARYEQAVADLNTQATTLRRLEAKQPYPDDDNLKSVEASVKAYDTAITGFIQKLNAIEVSLDEKITPQIFQDNLRQAVNDLQNEANKNKVALPEKFFLGFEAYQSQLPTQDEVKKLNREFQVIKGLVTAIVPLGINSIDTLVRHPAANPPTPAPDPKAPPSKQAQPALEPIRFDSFTLGITAPQNSFIKAFDKIPDSPGFLVVRSLTIENTNPAPPPKTAPGQPGTAAPNAPAPKPAASDKLPMIFGSESVKATILFEVPDFPEKTAPSPTPTPPIN